jgi:hypothetical protein
LRCFDRAGTWKTSRKRTHILIRRDRHCRGGEGWLGDAERLCAQLFISSRKALNNLPRVAESTWERISRELDHLGPQACVQLITDDMRANNPELLDIATKCAGDIGEREESMLGFCVFYRLLLAQAASEAEQPWAHAPRPQFDPLPRVTPETRAAVSLQIDQQGPEGFTRDSMDELERSNPVLLQLAHRFAARHPDYLGAMQGFALLYACMVKQTTADRSWAH